MTTLDLLRHGQARPAAAGGDAQRALTAEGTRVVERLGRHLGTLGWRPERAYASPLLRARQTAAVVLLAARVPLTIETLDALVPDHDPGTLAGVLASLEAAGRHVLLVGHQPLLGELAGWACDEPRALLPGQLVRVTFDGPIARGAGRLALELRPDAI